jgi:biopolymer transport protein ExbB
MSDAPVRRRIERRLTVFDLIRQGGPVMAPIILISLAAIGLIIERAIVFLRAREKRPDIGAWVIERMEKGGMSELAGELGASPSPEAQVLLDGVKCRNLPAAEREARMQARALREMGKLEKNVAWLSSVANIETLLGLLGTVTGMIRSFISLRLSGVADPSVLAGGIAEALITTAAGLLVAIPSHAAYHELVQIINKTTTRVEMASADFQAFLARRRGLA